MTVLKKTCEGIIKYKLSLDNTRSDDYLRILCLRINCENDVLRRRNLLLEERFLAVDFDRTRSVPGKLQGRHTKPRSIDSAASLKTAAVDDVTSLRTKHRSVCRDNIVLRNENEVTFFCTLKCNANYILTKYVLNIP